MIDHNTILSFEHYKKGKPFTGSYKGMRYRIIKEMAGGEDDIDRFRVDTWPEPLCYEATTEDKITTQRFTFDKKGYEEVISYLNDMVTEYISD
ncbi:MAG: hypothetical protein K6E98_02715 [Lachnospiraceae bacterium]|nr:hypothetical protein [Lachnospiraceae bacterium]